MSLRLSSLRVWNESSGIGTTCLPTLSHAQKPAKSKHVAISLGLEEYQGLFLLATSKVAPDFGDMRPKVSIDMRRISKLCSNAEGNAGETLEFWQSHKLRRQK